MVLMENMVADHPVLYLGRFRVSSPGAKEFG